jgi:hypothetical protein
VRRAVDLRAVTVGRRLALLAMPGLLAAGAPVCDGGGVERPTGPTAEGGRHDSVDTYPWMGCDFAEERAQG